MARQAEQDPTNLYIANLPHSVKESDLETMFSPYGQVSVNIVNDVINIVIVIISHILMTRNSPRHRPSLLSSFHYDHNHDRLCQLEFSGTPTNSLEGSGSPGWRVGTSVSR